MEGLLPLIIQLLSGAVGGNLIGKFLPNLNLGTLGNSIAGILGGGVGGSLLGMLGIAAAPSGALDIGSILGSIGSGFVGGGVLMFIVGLIKKLLGK
jgi:uncharacterized membrane protein YeaQ/YmgE (transglycosylase-associated protein family)